RSQSLSQDTLHARLLDLQANLNRIQNDYSREQARQSYLKLPEQIHTGLLFSDKPLFPELEAGSTLGEVQTLVDGRLSELARSLKSVQVEMENMYALNFDGLPREGLNA